MANRKDDKTWLAIRTAYIVKRWSAQKCADEFHIDVTTIKKRASKEGWTKERHFKGHQVRTGSDTAEEETRKAVRDVATRQQELADMMIAWVANHIKDSAQDLQQMTTTSKKDSDKIAAARSRISARRDMVEMVDRFVKTGKIAGEDRPAERDDELIIEQRRLEPLKIAVGQDGRAIPQSTDDDEEE